MEENPWKPPNEDHRIVAGNWTPKVELMTDRDTHFQGSASLVIDEIDNALNGLLTNPNFVTSPMYDEVHQILTRRAYDLVAYALYKARRGCSMKDIADLTQWPDSQEPE